MLRVFRSKRNFPLLDRKLTNANGDQKNLPNNLWTRCDSCTTLIYNKELDKNMNVCHNCGFHFRISALDRLKYIVDKDSFHPLETNSIPDPLGFPGYPEKIVQCQTETKLDDAIVIGEARIKGNATIVGIIDFSFIGGSMGSVVGEQLTRGFEKDWNKVYLL